MLHSTGLPTCLTLPHIPLLTSNVQNTITTSPYHCILIASGTSGYLPIQELCSNIKNPTKWECTVDYPRPYHSSSQPPLPTPTMRLETANFGNHPKLGSTVLVINELVMVGVVQCVRLVDKVRLSFRESGCNIFAVQLSVTW